MLRQAKDTFKDAVKVSGSLFKIMIPIIILVKILKELDLISVLAWPLEPVMDLVNLPGSMGLVWATALLSNLYSAMIVFVSLAPENPVTVAQCTVLATMMLIAHNMPLELKIAQKCGSSLIAQALIRIFAALACGWALHLIYSSMDLLQAPNVIFWTPEKQPDSLAGWAAAQAANLFWIFLIILGLLVFMKLAKRLGITELLNRLLRPILKLMGIGPSASTITVVGLSLGIAYGSGLIMHEIEHGRVDRRDIFFSLSLMGLSHALIEDTLLMLMIGAHHSGIFWGRLIFSLVLVAGLVRIVGGISNERFERYLMSGGRKAGTSES